MQSSHSSKESIPQTAEVMKKILPLVQPIGRLVQAATGDGPAEDREAAYVDGVYEYTTPDEWISINVGGTTFLTQKSTLEKLPGSRLAQLDSDCPIYDKESKQYLFDRNPVLFPYILDFYRTGNLHFPHNFCGPIIRTELDYWGINPNEISACCWNSYKEYDEQEETLQKLGNAFNVIDHFKYKRRRNVILSHVHKWRARIWYFLEDPKSSRAAQLWAMLYVLLIMVSVLSLALTTHEKFRVPMSSRLNSTEVKNYTNPKVRLSENTVPHPGLYISELVVNSIFAADLFTRMLVCPNKLNFFRSLMNWLDITVVLSQWVPTLVAFSPDFKTNSNLQTIYSAFIIVRICRVFLVFKLARHYTGLRILILALAASVKELLLLAIFIVIGMFIFSTFIFYAEYDRSDAFINIPTGFWWAIVTMTTVGYGDVHPGTAGGYAVGALCAVCGMLATGLPIPIIANNFTLYYTVAKLKNRMAKKLAKDRSNSYLSITDRSHSASVVPINEQVTETPAVPQDKEKKDAAPKLLINN